MFDTIIRNKSHYQKRAYQCIKCLVNLFSSCPLASHLLRTTPDFARKWELSIHWLHEELERRPFTSGSQYNYEWSPPAPSNDSSNSYYLERSPSARLTLKAAYDFLPEEPERQQETPDQQPEEGSDNNPHPHNSDLEPEHYHPIHRLDESDEQVVLNEQRRALHSRRLQGKKTFRNRSDPTTSLPSSTQGVKVDDPFSSGLGTKLGVRRAALSMRDDGFLVEDDLVPSLEDRNHK